MRKQRLTVIAGILACALVLTSVVLAMGSDNYRLDWFTPLTSSGGGSASSDSYAVDLAIGQSAAGSSAGAGYVACLGYWCGTAIEHKIYLPLVLRNH
jgi:hypothetical protein